MKIQIVSTALALSLSASSVWAGDASDRWNSLNEERQTELVERAAQQGFDITTEEGRTAFRDYRHEQRLGALEERWNSLSEEEQAERIERASEHGFDISTEEGRIAFADSRHEMRKELRNMTDEQRHAFMEDRWANLSEEKQTERIERAAVHGFDITTEEGRVAFGEARHERRQIFRDYVQSMSDEDRAALREETRGMTRKERRAFIRSRVQG